MRELIAITDVTEMWASEVCIAGVTPEFKCIRPVIEGGVQLWDLYKDDTPIIFPGAKVWMDFSAAPNNSPAHRGSRIRPPGPSNIRTHSRDGIGKRFCERHPANQSRPYSMAT